MFNYNVQKPKVLEVDSTDLHTIDGQNYITISAAEGRKLMRRIPEPVPTNIERVFVKGQQDFESDANPDFILLESKDYAKKHHMSEKENDFFQIIIETAKLQLSSLTFYQAILAEFIGVFILTLFIAGFGLSFSKDETTPSINGALGSGLIVATMVWCTNSISGANLNPAISIVLIFTNDLDLMRGLFYILFQLLGGCAGAATVKSLLPISSGNQSMAFDKIGLTLVNEKTSLFSAFCVEVVVTFVLAFTVFACLDKNRKDLGGSFPLTIGLAVTAGAFFGVNISFTPKLLYKVCIKFLFKH
jgi:glycerol uptake facilitator-like aquaporin